MKPMALNRLARLEQAHGAVYGRVSCIERVIVDPMQRSSEPAFYRDGLGNHWSREPDEPLNQFRARVTAEAIGMARPSVARIIGEAGQ
jgi:hypothetical protein